jgi:hypothetical protein
MRPETVTGVHFWLRLAQVMKHSSGRSNRVERSDLGYADVARKTE